MTECEDIETALRELRNEMAHSGHHGSVQDRWTLVDHVEQVWIGRILR